MGMKRRFHNRQDPGQKGGAQIVASEDAHAVYERVVVGTRCLALEARGKKR
jgi:hypothetical protein